MSQRQCSVWGCSNRKGRCPEDTQGNRRCSCEKLLTKGCPESSELLTLHNIGKMPPEVYKVVVAQLNKTRKSPTGKMWQPGTEAYVCNSHYEGFKGPTRANPTVVPTLFKRCHDFYTPVAKRNRRVLQRSGLDFQQSDEAHNMNMPKSLVEAASLVVSSELRKAGKVDDLLRDVDHLQKYVEVLKAEIEVLKTRPQRLDISLLTNTQLHFYTGLSKKVFSVLIKWLQPALPSTSATHNRFLTDSQKLLMVLMRMRQNLTQEDLACRFDVDQSTVSRVISQWLPLLAHQLKGLIQWPQTTIGPTKAPYNHFPNAVSIIDGTEVFIQRPSNLSTQKSSYSDYKSHTTVKYLVSIDSFTGVFNFVSPGYSGNASDRFIVENCSILDLVKPGQRVLADRGFTARDLFARKKAFLTMPSFLRGASKLTTQQAIETRTIASVRIRVENAIKRLKDFRILSQTLSNRINKRLVDDIVIVAAALCNLQAPLIEQ